MLKRNKPRIAPNGLQSFELGHAAVIKAVNGCGGLFPSMMGRLHAFHIADPKLAKCFSDCYAAGQRAQAILSKARKRNALHLGVMLTNGSEI